MNKPKGEDLQKQVEQDTESDSEENESEESSSEEDLTACSKCNEGSDYRCSNCQRHFCDECNQPFTCTGNCKTLCNDCFEDLGEFIEYEKELVSIYCCAKHRNYYILWGTGKLAQRYIKSPYPACSICKSENEKQDTSVYKKTCNDMLFVMRPAKAGNIYLVICKYCGENCVAIQFKKSEQEYSQYKNAFWLNDFVKGFHDRETKTIFGLPIKYP